MVTETVIPDPDRALLDYALRMQRAGRLVEADDAFAKYLVSNQGDAQALRSAASNALQAGRAPLAVRRYEQLVAMAPDDAAARNDLGYALIEAARPVDAVFHLERALHRNPRFAPAHNNLGIALGRLGRFREGIAAFERAIAADARHTDAAANLGIALSRAGDAARARRAFALALSSDPQHVLARAGQAFNEGLAGDLDGALSVLEALAEPEPRLAALWRMLGMVRFWLSDLDGAEDAFRHAAQIDPNDQESRFGVASAILSRGDYPRGFRAFEERINGRFGPARRFPELLVWSGAPNEGRLVVFAEQGSANVIQFARFIPVARRRVREVVFVADGSYRSLVPLLASLPGVDHLIESPEQMASLPPMPAARISVLSLPHVLELVPGSLPGAMPYLAAPADRSGIWKGRITSLPRPRVGLAWGASTRRDEFNFRTRQKSIPLAQFAPLVAIPGISFFTLQQDAGGDRAALGALAERIVDLTFDVRDYGDLAAIIDGLDLVIGADNPVVHVAGAMGKPVWLLDRANGSWRWRLSADASPWYPTMRIFRQQRQFDWTSAIAAATAALAGVVAGERALP